MQPQASPPPTRIDRYVIERELGRGGFGAVYRARHSVIGRVVALKLLLPERTTTPTVLERFLREARAIGAIGSPHIVEIYDAGLTDAGEAFLAMELLEGEDLGQHLRRVRAMPLERACEIVRDILAALSVAHRAGIVHRDMKPGNVFLARLPDGSTRTKVLDFGISKIRGGADGEQLTMTGALLGTPHYMAPEQLVGSKDVDGRADLYAVATVLFELVSGQLPYDAPSLEALISGKLADAPRPLRAVAPHVPAALADVVARGLSYDASARFGSADEMSRAIDLAVGHGARAAGAAGALAATTVRPPGGVGGRAPSSRPPSFDAMATAPTSAAMPAVTGVRTGPATSSPVATPLPSSVPPSAALPGIVHSTAPGAAPGTVASPFLRLLAIVGVLAVVLVVGALLAALTLAAGVTFLGYELVSEGSVPVSASPVAGPVTPPSPMLAPAPVVVPAAPASPARPAPTELPSPSARPAPAPSSPPPAAPSGAVTGAGSSSPPSASEVAPAAGDGVTISTSAIGAIAAGPVEALADRALPRLERCRGAARVRQTYQVLFGPSGAIVAVHVYPQTTPPTSTDECVLDALRASGPARGGTNGIVRYTVTLDARGR